VREKKLIIFKIISIMKTIKTTKTILIGLFTICAVALSNTSFAGSNDNNLTQLKFVGKVNNRPVFQLKLNNNVSAVYYINIKDANSNVLYAEKVKGAHLTRNYQLDIDQSELDSPDFGLRVEVTSSATHKTEVYKVSTQTSVTKDIIVAQL
jgi:hypothetical protein